MLKKQKTKVIRIIIFIVALLNFLIALTSISHVALAGIWVQYERCCAAETYRVESLSPNGSSETWDEMEANINAEFSDGSWAIKLVSNNIDKDVSNIIVLFMVTSFSMALISAYWFCKKTRQKKNADS